MKYWHSLITIAHSKNMIKKSIINEAKIRYFVSEFFLILEKQIISMFNYFGPYKNKESSPILCIKTE